MTHPEGCESGKVKVALTIKETGVPEVVSSKNPAVVCAGQTNPTFTASKLVGTVTWYESDPGALGIPGSAVRGSNTTFVPTGTAANTYTIWAVQYAGGCYGPKVPASYTINPIPVKPTVTGAEVCYGEGNLIVSATGETGAIINWYTDAAKGSSLQSVSQSFLSSESEVGTYYYYAAQKINGCEGQTEQVSYRIKSLPSAPVMMPQSRLCEYDAAPTLTASGQNIKWYDGLGAEIGTGTTYATTDMVGGNKKYYATQTVEGCEGAKGLVSYTIYAKPSNPTVTGASVCEGETQIPKLTTNMITDKWYADETAVTYLQSGYNYTPDAAAIGNSNKTYYVQREMNGCLSDIMPVVLKVIAKPTFTIGDDITKCIYDTVETIQASNFSPAMNADSYVNWTISSTNSVNNVVDNAEHNITPRTIVVTPGTYHVSALFRYNYDNIYCASDEVSITYTVIGRARKPIVFTQVICQGEDIKDLQALGSPNMVWGSLDGTLPVVDYGQRYHFQEGQTLVPNTYRFVIYDRNIYDTENNLGCMSEIDTVSMTVAPAAQTKLFGTDSVCVGAIAEQYYTQYTKGSQYYWNVTGGHLNYAKTDATSVRYVDWTKSGVDTVTVFEQTWAGCQGFDTIVVKIAPRPVPMFTWTMPGSSNLIELTDSTIQDSLWYVNAEGERVGEQVPYTMEWNFGHQGESETDVDTVIQYNHRNLPILEGDYLFGYNCPILTVTNDFGCSEKYTECVYVNIATSLYIPNAFSPTNPAESVRTFQPKGFNLMKCEISVYDKWGNLIWYSNEVKNGAFVGSWDGRCNGKMMKSDIYIWKMEATFLDGQEWEGFDAGNGKKTKFGSVTLIR